MPSFTIQAQQLDKINRADRLLATIALLEQQIKTIEANGEVAPSRCHLARYQARGKYKAYWYYKLHADTPIFPSKRNSNKLSRYKHLGSAGSQAHVDGVMMVLRRTQIDDLQKAIDALRDSWSDLYSDSQDSHKKTK
jgi:hypothetical protein